MVLFRAFEYIAPRDTVSLTDVAHKRKLHVDDCVEELRQVQARIEAARGATITVRDILHETHDIGRSIRQVRAADWTSCTVVCLLMQCCNVFLAGCCSRKG